MRVFNLLGSLVILTTLIGCASRSVNGMPPHATTKTIEETLVRSGKSVRIRVEIWTDCLCGGPTHGNTYGELEKKRDQKMLFGQEYELLISDRTLDPIQFLVRHLPVEKKALADRIFKGLVYHKTSDGRSYMKYRNGGLWKMKMEELKSGDLLVCYPEVY